MHPCAPWRRLVFVTSRSETDKSVANDQTLVVVVAVASNAGSILHSSKVQEFSAQSNESLECVRMRLLGAYCAIGRKIHLIVSFTWIASTLQITYSQ